MRSGCLVLHTAEKAASESESLGRPYLIAESTFVHAQGGFLTPLPLVGRIPLTWLLLARRQLKSTMPRQEVPYDIFCSTKSYLLTKQFGRHDD